MAPLIPIAMGLAQYVPNIIKLFNGSDKAADVAAAVVGVAQAVTGAPTPEAAAQVIGADPDKMLAFQQAMAQQQVDLELAYLSDTQSARARDIELTKAGNPNYRANVMAALAALTVLVCLMVTVWVSDMDDFAKATITLITGRALGWVEQVFNFEYGTNRASKVKDDTIKLLSK